MRSLQIGSRYAVATNFMGDYTSVFKGRGIVFESFREYTSADDSSMIDWRASARVGKQLVREYAEERNLDVFFLVDSSYSMVFGSQKKLKHEYTAEMVSSMAYSILQKGDSVGVALFSDGLRDFLPPTYGLKQHRKILRILTDPSNYDGPCDLASALKACMHRLKKSTVLVLVTDFLQFSDGWQLPLKVASQKFDIIPLVIQDPRDLELPDDDSQIVVENPHTGEQMLLSVRKVKEEYAKISQNLLYEKLNLIKRINVSQSGIIKTDKAFSPQIVKYLERRKRRWR